MRCFLAIEVTHGITIKATVVQKSLSEIGGLKAKFVEPQNMHITLKFFGELDGEKINEIRAKLEQSALPICIAEFRKVGCFPNTRHPRVAWIGVSGLELLLKKLEHVLGRVDKPHLTLARIRFLPKASQPAFSEFVDKNQQEFGSVVVKEIKMKKSVLTPKGPIYSDVFSVRLGAAEQVLE